MASLYPTLVETTTTKKKELLEPVICASSFLPTDVLVIVIDTWPATGFICVKNSERSSSTTLVHLGVLRPVIRQPAPFSKRW
jgi:hypothetical protein